LDQIINPFILYGAIALGAAGVALALPRRGTSPQILGALLAGIAGGVVILALTLKHLENAPTPFFYIFSVIALGSALRVITHQRPVYAALWFIMVVLSSAGMLLLLSAEFMAAALIIVYAGAILITYLFVIMLATQAPEEGETEVLAQYDTVAREPIVATLVGFVLLAVLTTMIFRGVGQLGTPDPVNANTLLTKMPRKVESILRNSGDLKAGERVFTTEPDGDADLDAYKGAVTIIDAAGGRRTLRQADWPKDLRVTNVEGVGFNLLSDHPGTIEIAGVILLMAMLGATVLSRKQVQLDEEAKLRQSHALSSVGEGSGGGT
jgi:NADH-quinone oxidoreductase subunit J